MHPARHSWMILLAALSLGWLPLRSLAASPATMDRWLDRTRFLESSNGRNLYGDRRGGVYRSLGPYMIQAGPWRAYGGRGPWHVYAHREPDARAVAARIMRACERACIRDKKPVTFRNVRWYYRHGGY